jgi:hypothetical protein
LRFSPGRVVHDRVEHAQAEATDTPRLVGANGDGRVEVRDDADEAAKAAGAAVVKQQLVPCAQLRKATSGRDDQPTEADLRTKSGTPATRPRGC